MTDKIKRTPPSISTIVSATVSFYKQLFCKAEHTKVTKHSKIRIPSIAIRSHGSSGYNEVFDQLRAAWQSLNYMIIELDPWESAKDIEENTLKQDVYQKVLQHPKHFWWQLTKAWLRHFLTRWGPKILIVGVFGFILTKYMFLDDYSHPNLTKNVARGTTLLLILGLVMKIFGALIQKALTQFIYKNHGDASIFTWFDIKKCAQRAIDNKMPLVIMLYHLDQCSSTEIVSLLKEVNVLSSYGILVVTLFEYRVIAAALETEFKSFKMKDMKVSDDYLVPAYSELSTYSNVNLYRPLYTEEHRHLTAAKCDKENYQFISTEEVEQCTSELIHLSARHLRLSKKATNGYLITIKLYAAFLQIEDQKMLRHLAALLFIERYDPLWLDYYFHGRPADKTVLARIPVINDELKKMLTGENYYGEFWFELMGRSFHDSSYSNSVRVLRSK